MRCDDDPAVCLGLHITPCLDGAVQVRHGQWTACCPTHDDAKPSLSIGIGRQGIRWTCHAGCDWAKVRTAMIRRRVPEGCLPYNKQARTEDELIAELIPVLKEGPATLTHLRIVAVVYGLNTLPRGGRELLDLAAKAGVPGSTAYDAVARAKGARRNAGRTPGGSTPRHVLTTGVTERRNPDANPQVDGSCYGTEDVQISDAVSRFRRRSVTRSVTEGPESVTERPRFGLPVTPPRRCEACEHELPPDATARRRYCGDACRVKGNRQEHRKENHA